MASVKYTAEEVFDNLKNWQYVEEIILEQPGILNKRYNGVTILRHVVYSKSHSEEFLLTALNYSTTRDIEELDQEGQFSNILHPLSVQGFSKAVAYVLDVTSKRINSPDKDGSTPLHWLLRSNLSFEKHRDTAKILLDGGAAVYYNNNEGLTPFDKYIHNPCSEYEDRAKQKEELLQLLKSQAPLEVLARGAEANIACLDAIREGSKSVYQTRLMLVGQERVGKTSLVKALTEQEFDVTEPVTDGIEASLTCTVNVRNTTNWKPNKTNGVMFSWLRLLLKTPSQTRQEYLQAIAENMTTKLLQKKDDKQNNQASKNTVTDEERKEKEENIESDHSGADDKIDPFPDSLSADIGYENEKNPAGRIPSKEEPEVPEEVFKLVLKGLKENEKQLEHTKLKGKLDDLTLNIWDFAGQDIYYITHQMFLVSRAVYIICFNLCHDLDAPAKVEVFNRHGEMISVADHYMNNSDFVTFWSRSIYSNTTENPIQSNQKQLSPPIFIVGTHRDNLPGNDEERQALAEEKLKVVKKSLKRTPYEGHVVSKFYAIDNSLRSPLDKSIIELREHITEVAKNERYMGEKIPLKWLNFLNKIEQLRHQEKHSINFKEVNDLAAKCGIVNRIQLFTMLHFYHDLGNIIYYGEYETPDNALNDIIILSSQWLICIFSRVITVKNSSEQWARFASSWARLDEEGILEEKLLRHLWHDLLEQFEGLLQLMQKFDLLCLKTSIENSERCDRVFYAPSLLKKQCEDVCVDDWMDSTSVVILYIDFNGFLPEGLFHRLLVQLVNWSQTMGGEPKLFYQQANLYVDEDHSMIIRIFPEKRSFIQVAIKHANHVDSLEPRPDVCKQVWKQVDCSLSRISHTWMKRSSYEFRVLCNVCDKANNHFHDLNKCLQRRRVQCGLERMQTECTSATMMISRQL